MLPAIRALTLLIVAAVALALAGAIDARAAAAGGADGGWMATLDIALQLSREWADRAGHWIATGYARRPAVMIGLGGVLLLPPLLVFGAWLYRRRPVPAVVVTDGAAGIAGGFVARLELEGAHSILLPPGRDLVQIGRQEDNDICIDDESVQRYHAVIERTGDTGFTIVDVSGLHMDGLRVNGQPRSIAMLADGDTLELGRARMRFATAA